MATSNKVIVITGANGGLGRALAQRFIEDGDTVVLLGRTLSKVQEVAAPLGDRALAVQCDVTSPDSVRAAFAEIAKAYPRIDALINNAAIFEPLLIEEATDDQIVQGILANLAGPMLCARSAIPLLGDGGFIINVSSESVGVTFPMLTVYQASKAGLEQFSRDLNLELDEKGIRVTTVRAGQMGGPGMSSEMSVETAGRFIGAAMMRGVNIIERGLSQYQSTTGIFRMILDTSPDVQIGNVAFQSRPVR
jgi:meso-butanediol dehydrogenase/(S,S)-butanediol dehydrogenase/diacetyl reductase